MPPPVIAIPVPHHSNYQTTSPIETIELHKRD